MVLTRSSHIPLIAIAACIALAVGVSAVIFPPLAVLPLLFIVVGVGYLYLGTLPSVILLLCGTFSLPAMIRFGPVSGLALLTVMYAGIIVLSWIASRPTTSPIPMPALPYLAFLVWAVTSTVANSRLDVDAIQNLLVLSMPVILIALLCSDSRLNQIPLDSLQRVWSASSITAVVIFMLLSFSPAARFVDDAGARSFALFAMLSIAWHAASWKYGVVSSRWISIALLAAIGLSLSRTALIVSVLLVVLSRFNPARGRDWITTICWLVIGGTGVYWGVSRIDPLRERFFEGDTSLQIGGLSINAMGRTWMWETTLDSYKNSRWVGQGSASVQELMSSLSSNISHPHNDYLRILHDFGAVGMLLWMVAIGVFMVRAVRAWMGASSPAEATVHLATVLLIVGLSLSMLTDNPIIYVFCMVPFGITVGSSIALEMRKQENSPQGSEQSTETTGDISPDAAQSLPVRAAVS